MDNRYPQKPQVAPQTGRMPQAAKRTEFLAGLNISELRQIVEFSRSHLYAFIVNHMEKAIRTIERSIGSDRGYVDKPVTLAYDQGRIAGIRAFHEVFTVIDNEYKRRIEAEAAHDGDNG